MNKIIIEISRGVLQRVITSEPQTFVLIDHDSTNDNNDIYMEHLESDVVVDDFRDVFEPGDDVDRQIVRYLKSIEYIK